ncbi:MAG: hypothetical protein PVF91_00930 [Chromatiales bacterium]|jgi:hypothetical protein
MWAPIAAIVFAIGIVNTPAMIDAERTYLQDQEPVIDVREIQASEVEAEPAPEDRREVN